MTDVRDREALRQALEPTLGAQPTALLLEQLPPVPSDEQATRSDLSAMEGRFDARLTEIDRRWDERFEELERRWDERITHLETTWNDRITHLDQKWDDRTTHLDEKWDERWGKLEAELKASFRGELNAALVSQTRTVVFSTLGAVVSMSGVAFVLATMV
jgi:predicted nuclease with TOPRIM domain